MPELFAYHPPYARWAHVLLRVFAGAIIAQHGAQKILGVLGGMGAPGATAPFLHQFWFAGMIELVGGALIMVGLFTRLAGFIMSGELAVAYFTVHAPRGFWPIENKGELAVTLCFVFLYFAATGAGAISLDYLLARRPKPVMSGAA
jgi:putative oxidoreductase